MKSLSGIFLLCDYTYCEELMYMKYFQSNQKYLGCVQFLKLLEDADLSVVVKFIFIYTF